MTVQTLTLNVPEALYQRLQHRAAQAKRTVEDETVDVLAAAVSAGDALPAELAEAVSQLALLDDTSLWRAACTPFAAEAASQLEELHLKRQREGLTDAETQTVASLVRQYERALLVRAQAAALLHQRGHDVSTLVVPG
jgi:plasmid stability protein